MTQNEIGANWAETFSHVTMARVKKVREAQGMTAQALAERCTELGFPMARNVVANLESGRRTTLTMAELLIFCRALDMPLMAMMYDDVDFCTEVEAFPGVKMSAYAATLALQGILPARVFVRGPRAQALPGDAARHRLYLAREIATAEADAIEDMRHLQITELDRNALGEKIFRQKTGMSSEDAIRARRANIADGIAHARSFRWYLKAAGAVSLPKFPGLDEATALAGFPLLPDDGFPLEDEPGTE